MNIEIAISISISLISLLVSIYAFIRSNKVANAELDIVIHNLIHQSRHTLDEVLKLELELADSIDEKRQILTNFGRKGIEELLNAYEEACTRYLNKQIDQAHFRQRYKQEILQVVKDKAINLVVDFKDPDVQKNRYKAIFKVFEEFAGT